MSQKILKMCVLILLIFLSLNLAKVNSKAVSHGCKNTGSGPNEKSHCLSSNVINNPRRVYMSSKYYFEFGGVITRTEAYTTSDTYNVAFQGSALWPIATISATAGVTFSVTQTIGVGASWNVPPKYFAQIQAVYYKKNVDLQIWDAFLSLLISRTTGDPSISNNYFISVEYSQ